MDVFLGPSGFGFQMFQDIAMTLLKAQASPALLDDLGRSAADLAREVRPMPSLMFVVCKHMPVILLIIFDVYDPSQTDVSCS